MRLKNKGVKYLNREYYGDMLVTIKAEPPKTLDKKSKELLQELQKTIDNKNYPKYNSFLDKIKK